MSDRRLVSERPGDDTGPHDLSEALKSSWTASNSPGHPEYCEGYPRIVAYLNDGTRVIECGDGIQWAIQKYYPSSDRPWRSKYFFRSKEGLLLYAPKPTAPELLVLPDWFPDPSLRPDGGTGA